jgi:hypothetical protein
MVEKELIRIVRAFPSALKKGVIKLSPSFLRHDPICAPKIIPSRLLTQGLRLMVFFADTSGAAICCLEEAVRNQREILLARFLFVASGFATFPTAFFSGPFVFRLAPSASTLFPAPTGFIHSGPRSALGLIFGDATFLVAFLNVLCLALLLSRILRFISAGHISSFPVGIRA